MSWKSDRGRRISSNDGGSIFITSCQLNVRLTSWKKFPVMILEHDRPGPPGANHGLESQLPNGAAKSEGVCHVFSRVLSVVLSFARQVFQHQAFCRRRRPSSLSVANPVQLVLTANVSQRGARESMSEKKIVQPSIVQEKVGRTNQRHWMTRPGPRMSSENCDQVEIG